MSVRASSEHPKAGARLTPSAPERPSGTTIRSNGRILGSPETVSVCAPGRKNRSVTSPTSSPQWASQRMSSWARAASMPSNCRNQVAPRAAAHS